MKNRGFKLKDTHKKSCLKQVMELACLNKLNHYQIALAHTECLNKCLCKH